MHTALGVDLKEVLALREKGTDSLMPMIWEFAVFHVRLPDCYTLWNIKAVRILPGMLQKVDDVLYIII